MKVIVIQRILPEYRIALFECLNTLLHREGIDFQLFYGDELPGTTPQSVKCSNGWSRHIHNSYLKMGSVTTVLQKAPLSELLNCDLIIIEQANNLLINYLLIAVRPLFRYKLAFWGHGYNHQSISKTGISERLKTHMLHKVDWWFAYTGGTSRYLAEQAFPISRITTLRNTIDTRTFQQDLDSVTSDDLQKFAESQNLCGQHVAVYCGGLTELKRIDTLLESALLIKERLPNFTLLIAGIGPQLDVVNKYCERYPWIHYLGKVYRKEKAILYRSAEVMLMPGMVGLVAIDAMIAELPIIVCELRTHSPEIEYIQEYSTGVFSQPDAESYAKNVISLLKKGTRYEQIVNNCRSAKKSFSIVSMAEHFKAGIVNCISESTPVREQTG